MKRLRKMRIEEPNFLYECWWIPYRCSWGRKRSKHYKGCIVRRQEPNHVLYQIHHNNVAYDLVGLEQTMADLETLRQKLKRILKRDGVKEEDARFL